MIKSVPLIVKSHSLMRKELAKIPDENIDTRDVPELDDAFLANAKRTPPRKKPNVSVRLDEDVVECFKGLNPKGYTARMAAVLSADVQAHRQK